MKFTDFLGILIITGLAILTIELYFAIPVVYWSTSQEKCVKVMYDGIDGGCDELPDKYQMIYVK